MNVHLRDLVTSASAKMLRTGPWKYIYTLVDGHKVAQELYYLETDPDEWSNLANDPAQAGQLAAYRDEILRWLVATEVNRLHPLPENHYIRCHGWKSGISEKTDKRRPATGEPSVPNQIPLSSWVLGLSLGAYQDRMKRHSVQAKKTTARFWLVLLCMAFVLVACTSSATSTLAPIVGLEQRHVGADCTFDGPIVALVGGTLIDGTGATPVLDATLVLQGRCIVDVGPRDRVSLPAGAQIIELEGATVLPGLIDAHVHNAYQARNLQTWAQAGVTTVRDLGAPLGYPYFSKRDQLAADLRNARVVSAGPLVTVPDGYPIVPNQFASLTVTSPEDARAKIAELVDRGADVIKIAFSSSLPTLSPEEAAAIVQTAHERGVPVTAHATNPQELKRALDAGVDDVAHMSGDRVKNATLRRLVQRGVYWVPTLEALHGEGAENLARFIEAGGQVALGTDAGYLAGLEIGLPMDEINLMQEAGMTPMQILVAATRNAAHVCRLAHELGTLEPGKLADVLVVDGDPLEDLEALTRGRLVIHNGEIIRGE